MADHAEHSPKLPKGMDKWELEEAARTLERAQEIALEPKLLTAARKLLRFQEKAKKKAIDWAENI
jgi:hypothetical protein